MDTTRSFNSSTLGSIFASATQILLRNMSTLASQRSCGSSGAARLALLEDQPGSPCCVGQCLHPSVVLEAAAVEHHALDPLGLRPLGQQLADDLGGGDVATRLVALAEFLAARVHGQDRAASVVVDHLGVD